MLYREGEALRLKNDVVDNGTGFVHFKKGEIFHFVEKRSSLNEEEYIITINDRRISCKLNEITNNFEKVSEIRYNKLKNLLNE